MSITKRTVNQAVSFQHVYKIHRIFWNKRSDNQWNENKSTKEMKDRRLENISLERMGKKNKIIERMHLQKQLFGKAVLEQRICTDQNCLGVSGLSSFSAFTKLSKTTISFVLYIRPHGTTRIPPDGFSLNFIFADFLEIYRENSSSIKI